MTHVYLPYEDNAFENVYLPYEDNAFENVYLPYEDNAFEDVYLPYEDNAFENNKGCLTRHATEGKAYVVDRLAVIRVQGLVSNAALFFFNLLRRAAVSAAERIQHVLRRHPKTALHSCQALLVLFRVHCGWCSLPCSGSTLDDVP